MQVLLSAIGLMLTLAPSPARATEAWEYCLDLADFNFSFDENMFSSLNAAKTGCKMKFSSTAGAGEAFELDLCDSNIHIRHYPSVTEVRKSRRLDAGSAGCPAPLFGADFDGNAKEIGEYKAAKTRALEIWKKIRDSYSSDWAKVSLKTPRIVDGKLAPEDSAYRFACGDFLLQEYVTKCMSFEQKKAEATTNVKSSVPGIHDQTILKKSP